MGENMTPLDQAHAAMEAGGEPEALAFWRAFADAELFLVLEQEAQGDTLEPRVFDLSMGSMLLAFDTEERLATISDTPVPYAALPGRVVAAQLAGQELALGLNLGTGAGCETVLAAGSIDWLAQMLTQEEPEERVAQIERLAAPLLPEGLGEALRALLPPQAKGALAQVSYTDGGWGHVLALSGLTAEDAPRMGRAVTEALAFSGLDAAALDLVFTEADAPLFARIAQAGQQLQPMPRAPVTGTATAPKGPGTDPDRPPRLK
jgi:hypothetical protein